MILVLPSVWLLSPKQHKVVRNRFKVVLMKDSLPPQPIQRLLNPFKMWPTNLKITRWPFYFVPDSTWIAKCTQQWVLKAIECSLSGRADKKRFNESALSERTGCCRLSELTSATLLKPEANSLLFWSHSAHSKTFSSTAFLFYEVSKKLTVTLWFTPCTKKIV